MSGIMMSRRAGRHRSVGGGGGAGSNGPDDYFDAGSSIDTTGARYAGAYPWTVVNALSTTNSVSGGILTFSDPGFRAGMTPVLALQTIDAGDGAWRARVDGSGTFGNYKGLGVVLRESATGKMLLHGFAYDSAQARVQVRRMSDLTTWFANYGTISTPDLIGYVEIVRDGSTLIFIYSEDNVTWFELARAAQTADFTTAPDQVGIWWVPVDNAPGPQTGQFYEFLYKNRAVPYGVPLQSYDAENGVAGWTNVTGAIGTRSDVRHSGSSAYKINGNPGAFEIRQDWKALFFDSLIDAGGGGGVTATLGGWGRPWDGGTGTFRIRLDALNASGSSLGSSASSYWTPSTSWTQKTCALALPANTRTLRITYEGTTGSTDDCWLDDLTLSLS